MRPTWKGLLLPIAVAAILSGAAVVSLQYCDPEDRRIVGGLFMAQYLAGAGVVVWELIALPRAAAQLWRNPALRLRRNFAAICIAVLYVVGTVMYLAQVTRFG